MLLVLRPRCAKVALSPPIRAAKSVNAASSQDALPIPILSAVTSTACAWLGKFMGQDATGRRHSSRERRATHAHHQAEDSRRLPQYNGGGRGLGRFQLSARGCMKSYVVFVLKRAMASLPALQARAH